MKNNGFLIVLKNILLKLVTQVARDVKKELPPDMIKAVDLSAEMSFIAFTIGVQVDLEQVRALKEPNVKRA